MHRPAQHVLDEALAAVHREKTVDDDPEGPITLTVTASLFSGATYTAQMKRHWTHGKVLAALGARGMPSLIDSKEHFFVGSIKYEPSMRLMDLPVEDGKLHLTIVRAATKVVHGHNDAEMEEIAATKVVRDLEEIAEWNAWKRSRKK
jgi:hypothetical protein